MHDLKPEKQGLYFFIFIYFNDLQRFLVQLHIYIIYDSNLLFHTFLSFFYKPHISPLKPFLQAVHSKTITPLSLRLSSVASMESETGYWGLVWMSSLQVLQMPWVSLTWGATCFSHSSMGIHCSSIQIFLQ